MLSERVGSMTDSATANHCLAGMVSPSVHCSAKGQSTVLYGITAASCARRPCTPALLRTSCTGPSRIPTVTSVAPQNLSPARKNT